MQIHRQQLRPLVGFAVSALLVALLVRTVDFAAVGRALAAADLRFVPMAIALHLLGVWARSVRWRLLLPPGSASTSILFRVLIVGFTANNLLPARLGEIARAYLLARWCGIVYGVTLASLVVERALDGLALAVILLVSLTLVPAAPSYLLAVGLAAGAAFAAGTGGLLGAAWRADKVDGWGQGLARHLPGRGPAIFAQLVSEFAAGLQPVRARHLLAPLGILSLLGWVCELALFYVLMAGFGIPASIPIAMLDGAAANFATLIPSSPGYVGTFDGVLVKVLADLTTVPVEQITAYALVVHATLVIPITLLGALIVWRAGISLEQFKRADAARALARSQAAEG